MRTFGRVVTRRLMVADHSKRNRLEHIVGRGRRRFVRKRYRGRWLLTAKSMYLIVIVLVSLRSGLVPSAVVSIIAYLCLDYFFTATLFTLGMNQILDFVAPIAYVATAFVITNRCGIHIESKADKGHQRQSSAA